VTRIPVVACAVALLALCDASSVQAQTAEPGRFELGVGPLWIGSASFGTRTATETTSSGASAPPFSATTALDAATGIEARFAMRVARRVDVETVGSYGRPHLVATVTQDLEAGAGPFTSDEAIQQFTVGGVVVWRWSALHSHPRVVPFAIGGVEYMRQLHAQQTLLVAGQFYEAGTGVKYLMRSRVGVRGEVRAIVRTAGVNVDGRAHVSPAIAASLFVRF